jgi:hypothetical protein
MPININCHGYFESLATIGEFSGSMANLNQRMVRNLRGNVIDCLGKSFEAKKRF